MPGPIEAIGLDLTSIKYPPFGEAKFQVQPYRAARPQDEEIAFIANSSIGTLFVDPAFPPYVNGQVIQLSIFLPQGPATGNLAVIVTWDDGVQLASQIVLEVVNPW